ncbi:MAG: DnaJ domain-containing protein [Myxococcales bacterium]|nr:DnaJ domain-containing protein [Myxococcales bacterium]
MSTVRRVDYYELLGVGRGATQEDIKRAYRNLAMELHPDRNPDNPVAEEKFKEASAAFSVLHDPERRARYDRGGHAAIDGNADAMDFSSIADVLEGLFGEVFGRKRERPICDVNVDLAVSLEEAARGAEKELVVERSSAQGTTREKLTVRVPAGVQNGAVRTVRGGGEVGAGGPGDLHVYIRVQDHPLFTRDGADVLCTVPITFPQAVLGADLDVPTLDGPVTMKLPPGTASGKVFRLRGKGLPIFGGAGKGDELVTVQVEVPTEITRKQRQLIESLQEEMGDDSMPSRRGFLEKLRGLMR